MAKKKKPTRKELLKKEDEFLTLSRRAINFFTLHLKFFKIAGLVLVLIAATYIAGHFYIRSVNRKGQNAYNLAYYTLTKENRVTLDAKTLEKSEKLFQKVRDEFGMSKAARLALPQLALMAFTRKKYGDAADLYREFLDTVKGEPAYDSLTRLALAGCHEAGGKLKTAIEVLDPVLSRPESRFRELAMLRMARLYRLAHMPSKEQAVNRKFVREYPASPFLPVVKARL